ncbi:MAG TPA: hypothetical protein VF432_02180 [Thermoanaerobaculia bacterium]
MTFAVVVLAVLCLFLAATFLSRAGRIASTLGELRGRTVHVRVWGTPLGTFRVQSVFAVGAGLHFVLDSGGTATHLKVAQPGPALREEQRLVIQDARYMQWAGRRMPPAESVPALEMLMETAVS